MMEKSALCSKVVVGWCVGLLCGLCNGLPIDLENTGADSHTQLLTGLVAVLLTVCSVVLLAGCLCCQRRNGFKEDEVVKETQEKNNKLFRDSQVVASTASNLDHGHTNPVANGEFTIFTPLSPPHQNNNVFLANQQLINRTTDDYKFGDVDVSSWFDGTEKDFPRIKLKYIREIGKGWFGRVVEGAAQDVSPDQKWTPVVVRILEATASSKERVVFLHDAAIYRCGPHPNVLRLFGRCLDTVPLLLLQEFCSRGDLKNYLLENRLAPDKLLATEYPLVWCCQITSALKHLHDHKLTHPDLAARNCQLAPNLTLKLGDYGLSVFQYPDDYYQGAPGVSVRWCAPESLSYTSTTIEAKKMTTEGNIWSLAVTMWEICECGAQPYAGLSDDEVVSQVLGTRSVRLSRPTCQVLYTDYVFRLMQLCWTSSESRPAVAQINLMLTDLLQVYKNTTGNTNTTTQTAEEFDKRWASFKPNTIVKTDNHVSEVNTEGADIDIEDTDDKMSTSKPLSPSLNNLHGSLDNLSAVAKATDPMESWLENVATKTGDMNYVQGLSDAIKDLDNAIAMETSSSSSSSFEANATSKIRPIEFKLGPLQFSKPLFDSPNTNDSLTDSILFRVSSGSETEEENWKKKIERGAYSEKVRQKSRSVADLMVLTHIDQSESESDTPLPSLDLRISPRKNFSGLNKNLEGMSLAFGSEGNLLSVHDTFQDELKKLHEERRDNSLLFVPTGDPLIDLSSQPTAGDLVNKRLLEELNSPIAGDIKPPNQVFNVFNVVVSPVHHAKLDKIINYGSSSSESLDDRDVLSQGVPKLSDIIQSNSELVSYLTNNPLPVIFYNKNESDDGGLYDSGVEGDKVESTESLIHKDEEGESGDKLRKVATSQSSDDLDSPPVFEDDTKFKSSRTFQVPKLVDLIQDSDYLMDYIISRYENETIGVDKMADSFDSLEGPSTPVQTGEVTFDLSQSQDEVMPNSLTHSSTPFAKTQNGPDTKLYSLETWDNFLGKTLDDQNDCVIGNEFFDESFSAEPKSLLFIEPHNDLTNVKTNSTYTKIEQDPPPNNQTFTSSEIVDVDDVKLTLDEEVVPQQPSKEDGEGVWETNGGGWFLHPQAEVSGEMTPTGGDDSYVGFNVDDEVMAAIRNELITKLPQAQSCSSGSVEDSEEEWESAERNEVFVRYNVFNVPLSPIPEESYLEELEGSSGGSSPRRLGSANDDSDWSQEEAPSPSPSSPTIQIITSPLTNTPAWVTGEMAAGGSFQPHHRHTPSQESCCSNDTLFNLDEITNTVVTENHLVDNHNKNSTEVNETEAAGNNNKIASSPLATAPTTNSESDAGAAFYEDANGAPGASPNASVTHCTDSVEVNNSGCGGGESSGCGSEGIIIQSSGESESVEEAEIKEKIQHFLTSERDYCCVTFDPGDGTMGNLLFPANRSVAPLPSPEDNPWKQLPASLLSYDKIVSQGVILPPSSGSSDCDDNHKIVPEIEDEDEEDDDDCNLYVNLNPGYNNYENVTNIDDILNEADYANIVNLQNAKNSSIGQDNIDDGENHEADEEDDNNTLIITNGDDEDEEDHLRDLDLDGDDLEDDSMAERNALAVLTDIRFSGPGDSQLMSTSFSESNDLNDDQEWDSGSDTRSSSSGEFIWKEGEHEESLKALRAAPHDVLDDVKPMEGIQEESSTDESGSDEEEGESPEFVPSAWDKYATPTKSALRSPEKSLEKTDKKAKGVWFKKQKYHCVYEYPREPESPILHSYDLWKPQSDYNPYGGDNDEFFISGSSQPFDSSSPSCANLTSQFFPANSWHHSLMSKENVTPDSGVEDITPDSVIGLTNSVKTLKSLASEALRSKNSNNSNASNKNGLPPQVQFLGDLRHTKDRLRLDLPPSPSAFTTNKAFKLDLDSPSEPIAMREKPTFTTFGKKSRFVVQHVDTPPDEEECDVSSAKRAKNVSFEALPYRPQATLDKIVVLTNDFIAKESQSEEDDRKNSMVVEIVRGEASLLDSADEDSGIESSTLERKTNVEA